MSITSIAIVAIICWAIVEIVNGPKGKRRNKKEQIRSDELQHEVDELRQRVEVLEKIVTDDKYSLKKEFDNLKDDKVA